MCVHARVRVVDVVSRTASLIIANESLNGQLPTRVTASRTVLSTDRCRSGPARPAPALPCPAGPSTRYAGLQQHPTHVSTIRVLLFLTAAVSGTYPTKRSALKRCLLHSVSKKQHNFNAHQPILVIFGRDWPTAERGCYRTVFCFPTSPN